MRGVPLPGPANGDLERQWVPRCVREGCDGGGVMVLKDCHISLHPVCCVLMYFSPACVVGCGWFDEISESAHLSHHPWWE